MPRAGPPDLRLHRAGRRGFRCSGPARYSQDTESKVPGGEVDKGEVFGGGGSGGGGLHLNLLRKS